MLDETTVLLRGGPRDGQSTTVESEVTRLLAASEAPGMLDVYEQTDETAQIPGNDVDAVVFEYVGPEPAGDIAPEALHMPGP
ncbi:MAG: hypothetical protein M3Z02_05555 [Actinomycetota bacterium]|nr:hypothetical protein [Actinomycetota bacterium]